MFMKQIFVRKISRALDSNISPKNVLQLGLLELPSPIPGPLLKTTLKTRGVVSVVKKPFFFASCFFFIVVLCC